MFLLLYQFQFDVHTKDNWSICYQHLDIENCLQLNETTNLYEILDKLPKVDSIMTYFSDYHDEFMDGAYIGANWMNFNSNCIFGDASFRDSLLILKIDGFRIRIGDDINTVSYTHLTLPTICSV